MASISSVELTPVALGLASPAAGQNYLQLYHHLSPFTATTTPSPYVNSLVSANTHWTSRPSVLRHLNLLLRVLAFVFSFASSLALTVPPPQPAARGRRQRPFSFQHYAEFRYCISVTIIASIYSAFQLFKGVWDIAFKGFIIPEKVSDYITFFFDQVVAYLLMSSSSVCLLATQSIAANKFRAAAIVSTTVSFGAFLAIAASALLAGYTLCKRIIW